MDSKGRGDGGSFFLTARRTCAPQPQPSSLCFEARAVLQQHPEKPSSLDLKMSRDGKSSPPLGSLF